MYVSIRDRSQLSTSFRTIVSTYNQNIYHIINAKQDQIFINNSLLTLNRTEVLNVTVLRQFWGNNQHLIVDKYLIIR